jgi:oxalate decarboxylase/phosphoglucose isomerase-like protein (cupin superfamily)
MHARILPDAGRRRRPAGDGKPGEWLLWAMSAVAGLPILGSMSIWTCRARAVFMHVVHHAHLPHLHIGGELCIAAADYSRGIAGFEVWVRTLEAGAHTEPQRHGGELVVLALAGGGKLLIDGGPQRFNGPCTLLIPAKLQFQLVNNGTAPLQLVWVFTAAPTAVINPSQETASK